MRMNRRAPGFPMCVLLMLSACQALVGAQASTAPPAVTLSCAQMEVFLKTAKMGPLRNLPVGVTIPSKSTLDDGSRKHDASIQTVDIKKTTFQTSRGTELNFRDAWQFNVAGYELAKLLELNMVPPYVERKVKGVPGSLSWWVSDGMMEKDRHAKKIEPPDPRRWNEEMYVARVFHELVADTDFNMTNLLITKDWRLWMIDFTRAFRVTKTLQDPKQLTKIDRKLLANLRGLQADVVKRTLGRWLEKAEIDGLLARRELIVRSFDNDVATKGEAVVLFNLPRTSELCGAGLQ